ncbi:MAG: sugar transferase [Candidatus Moraniibacteriota bacterium]
MKRSELFFSAIQVPVDMSMILLASFSAFTIRNLPELALFQTKLYNFSLGGYLGTTALLLPIFLVVYALYGLYDIRATRTFWRESWQVFLATSLVLVIVIISIFLQRQWFASRFILLAGWILVAVYVAFGRAILRGIQKWLLVHRSVGVHRVVLVGSNGRTKRFTKLFRKNRSLGYRVVAQMPGVSIAELKNIQMRHGVDEVIITDVTLTDDEQAKLLDYCQIKNIAYKYLPTTLQTSRLRLDLFYGEPIIEIEHTPLDGWGKILKRSLDIVASLGAIVFLSPVMLVIAALIKLEDPDGPVIYKNERIGENGKVFFVYKFRYMKWAYCITDKNPNVEEAMRYEKELIQERNVRDDVLYKIKDDPRKMQVGAVIERYSLDELPQFFNVLFGSMSIVGPRPHQKREVDKYKEYHRRLLTIKPGITGMAQVSGRSDISFEDEYRLDVYYIENWSLGLDVDLFFKTIGVLFRRRKN